MRTNFENLRIYKLAEDLADSIWDVVWQWDRFARDTDVKKLKPLVDNLAPQLNACIKPIGRDVSATDD